MRAINYKQQSEIRVLLSTPILIYSPHFQIDPVERMSSVAVAASDKWKLIAASLIIIVRRRHICTQNLSDASFCLVALDLCCSHRLW